MIFSNEKYIHVLLQVIFRYNKTIFDNKIRHSLVLQAIKISFHNKQYNDKTNRNDATKYKKTCSRKVH